jgi:hypothetical protein
MSRRSGAIFRTSVRKSCPGHPDATMNRKCIVLAWDADFAFRCDIIAMVVLVLVPPKRPACRRSRGRSPPNSAAPIATRFCHAPARRFRWSPRRGKLATESLLMRCVRLLGDDSCVRQAVQKRFFMSQVKFLAYSWFGLKRAVSSSRPDILQGVARSRGQAWP